MEPTIRIREIGRRGDNIHRFGRKSLQGGVQKQSFMLQRWERLSRKELCRLLKDLGQKMEPVLAMDAKATERIFHTQGIWKLKHIDVAHLWMEEETGSKRLRVRTVKSEENVIDLGTKPLSKAVIEKHCVALGFVNMAEVFCEFKRQDVAMFWDMGSVQMIVTGGITASTQSTAHDYVKMNSRAVRSSGSGSGSSTRTSGARSV